MHKIAVLMSVYAAEQPSNLQRAIRSVLSQQVVAGAEIRVYLGVDGPVPTQLKEAIQQIEPELFKVFWFPKNRGLAVVLNDLIAAREDEEFLFRMDTDDLSLPGRFNCQIGHLLEHTDIDILGTSIVEVDSRSGHQRVVRFAKDAEDARNKIAMRVPVAHPTVCFRSKVFDVVTGYPDVKLNEDISFWFECMKAGFKFDNVPEALYEFTIGEDFWKRRGLHKAWWELRSYVKGIWQLEGLTWKLLLPLARFAFRTTPGPLQNLLYGSRLRTA